MNNLETRKPRRFDDPFLVFASGLFFYSLVLLLVNYPSNPYSLVILSWTLLVNYIAFKYTKNGIIGFVMKVSAIAWLIFAVTYIVMWAR